MKTKNFLVRRVLEDLKKNPHKREDYRKVLIKAGMLKNTTIRAKSVSLKELEMAKDQGITFVLI